MKPFGIVRSAKPEIEKRPGAGGQGRLIGGKRHQFIVMRAAHGFEQDFAIDAQGAGSNRELHADFCCSAEKNLSKRRGNPPRLSDFAVAITAK
jgi:hypothetical protein